MDDGDLGYTSQLIAARSAPELHTACRDVAAALGFGHYFYAIRVPVSLTEPYHFCLSGYPRDWRTRYDSRGYVRIDPIVHHAFASLLPVAWDEIDRSPPLIGAFFDEAASFGLVHGLSAPVCGRNGDLALLSFARGPDRDIPADPVERHRLKTRVHWLASVLHESVRRVILTREGAPQVVAPLSEREKDCLMWAADGKTSAEIGRQLGITERTVLFHIESAGRKLGASGRHNILARAVALGEIELHQHALRSQGPVPPMHE